MTEAHNGDHGAHDREGQLVRMANDIADFFKGQSDVDGAVTGIANHLKSFWTRSMLVKLTAYAEKGAPELGELPREALRRLNTGTVTVAPQVGGDAG
jgi:formate dehydrogenase subunit delta